LLSLKLRPTSSSTLRVPARPSTVFRITGGSPATNAIITIVVPLRPKITRNSGYIRTIGADASAATDVSQALRSNRKRNISMPSAMPTTTSSTLAASASCVVCQNRCGTDSSATMRGIAASTCDGSGTTNRLMTAARIRPSTAANAPIHRAEAERRRRKPAERGAG
jgi:hypothetical protein